MSFASNVTSAFTRVATEFRSIRTLITGSSTGDLSGLTTTTKASVLAAINELNAKPSGGATALTGLSDVTVGAYTAGRVLRANGTKFVDVDPTVYFEVAGAAAAAQTAAQNYASGLFASNDAMLYKGAINASANPNYPAADAGHAYKISAAGKIGGAAGVVVEVGDLIICTLDNSVAGTQAAVGANWDVIQTNIDGAVTGPAAATGDDFAQFNGVTGKIIKGGVSLDTDTALTANSTTRVPSQSAVKGYTYSQAQIGDPTTDFVTQFTTALNA